MPIRKFVTEIIDAGPLPECNSEEDRLKIIEIGDLIDSAPRPVTDEEAQELTLCFGPDDALGVAWSLLHLIETAPGRMTAVYGGNGTADLEFVELLNERVQNAAADQDEEV